MLLHLVFPPYVPGYTFSIASIDNTNASNILYLEFAEVLAPATECRYPHILDVLLPLTFFCGFPRTEENRGD
jgi:hypothetical protein